MCDNEVEFVKYKFDIFNGMQTIFWINFRVKYRIRTYSLHADKITMHVQVNETEVKIVLFCGCVYIVTISGNRDYILISQCVYCICVQAWRHDLHCKFAHINYGKFMQVYSHVFDRICPLKWL